MDTSKLFNDEESLDSDLEVANVLSKGLCEDVHQFTSLSKRCHTTPGKLASSPFRSSTVITNVTRGNIQTSSIDACDLSIYQLAAKGELSALKQQLEQDKEFNLNQTDKNNLTLLSWACANDQLPTVKYLMESGASVYLPVYQNSSPEISSQHNILLSVANGCEKIVKYLLENGMDPNTIGKDGNSALHYAVFCNYPECVKMLLEWGANITLVNSNNLSPMDIAVHFNLQESRLMLEKHILQLLESAD